MKLSLHALMYLALCTAYAGSLSAQTSQSRPVQPEVIKLNLHVAPADATSLEYKLLPDLIDQTPGDAVPLYLISARMGPDQKSVNDFMQQALDKYVEMPLDQLAHSDLEQRIPGQFATRLRYAGMAARRERANFEASLREEGVSALLPYLNDMRPTATLLMLQARLQMAHRDWRGAAHTCQTGFSMAHQLNDHAVVIQGLVETGIATMFIAHLLEWGTQPDSPNLYWALSQLPQPFVDLRNISQWEQAILYFTIPDLAHGDPAQLTAAQWRAILDSMIRLNEKTPAEGSTRPAAMPSVAQLVSTLSSEAKRALSNAGIPATTLDAMAPEQLVGLYLYRQYQTKMNEAWRAWELPVWQGAAVLPESPDYSVQHSNASNPFMVMVPALRRARLQFARLDQQIQISRLIEALRDYAARHDGHAPASLDDVKDLPMPIDPFTNQRFPYRVEGATAVIEPPALTFVPQIFQITCSK